VKKVFYHLQHPRSDKPHQVYGKPDWERRFGNAEWSLKVGGFSYGRIRMPIGEPRADLTIILPSPKIGDFVWTWYSDCIVTDSTLSLFTHAGFTGFQARPVTVERIKRVSRKRREELIIPPLWELVIKGKGGDAAPESGIHVIDEDEGTGILEYSSFRNGIIVDEANWDGCDFFTITAYPKYILVTERVKEVIIDQQLTNCALIPSHKLEWGSDSRPEESLEETRSKASLPLESLLADLESADVHFHTIYAIGYKGDPRAVDPLIGKFSHPDPFIWHSAASAVAAIAEKRRTPEPIREEIFSKLTSLLGHNNPLIRKAAGTALSFIGGERAAQEIMKLLDDPEDLVRDAAVFIMGFLRYKPAQERVRQLTRDRSKEVREMARIVLPRLRSEVP
jgi:hypothetical protein